MAKICTRGIWVVCLLALGACDGGTGDPPDAGSDAGVDAGVDGGSDGGSDGGGPILIAFATGGTGVDESAGSFEVQVSLSEVSPGTVTVDYGTVDEEAIGGGVDYDLPPGTLIFPPGETLQSISVTIVDDCPYEGVENFEIHLSNPTGAGLGFPIRINLAILDDDPISDCLTDPEFRARVAQRAVTLWSGATYEAGGTGNPGIDGAGSVVQTLLDLGYGVQTTTTDGLHYNYYSSGGLDFTQWYTIATGVEDADLKAGAFDGLEVGDLIFVDREYDYVFDDLAIYLGASGGFTHAALGTDAVRGSCGVFDLEDGQDTFVQAITALNSTSRRLDYSHLEAFWAP